MGWARFDDNYSGHPKIRDAGPWAELLDMRAIIYCARYDTDGRLTPTGLAAIRHGIPKVGDKVGRLVAVHRWEIDPSGGWQVRGFLDHNPSRAQRDDMRRSGRERQARFRASRNGVTNTFVPRGGEGNTELQTAKVRGVQRCDDCGSLEIDCNCQAALRADRTKGGPAP